MYQLVVQTWMLQTKSWAWLVFAHITMLWWNVVCVRWVSWVMRRGMVARLEYGLADVYTYDTSLDTKPQCALYICHHPTPTSLLNTHIHITPFFTTSTNFTTILNIIFLQNMPNFITSYKLQFHWYCCRKRIPKSPISTIFPHHISTYFNKTYILQ